MRREYAEEERRRGEEVKRAGDKYPPYSASFLMVEAISGSGGGPVGSGAASQGFAIVLCAVPAAAARFQHSPLICNTPLLCITGASTRVWRRRIRCARFLEHASRRRRRPAWAAKVRPPCAPGGAGAPTQSPFSAGPRLGLAGHGGAGRVRRGERFTAEAAEGSCELIKSKARREQLCTRT